MRSRRVFRRGSCFRCLWSRDREPTRLLPSAQLRPSAAYVSSGRARLTARRPIPDHLDHPRTVTVGISGGSARCRYTSPPIAQKRDFSVGRPSSPPGTLGPWSVGSPTGSRGWCWAVGGGVGGEPVGAHMGRLVRRRARGLLLVGWHRNPEELGDQPDACSGDRFQHLRTCSAGLGLATMAAPHYLPGSSHDMGHADVASDPRRGRDVCRHAPDRATTPEMGARWKVPCLRLRPYRHRRRVPGVWRHGVKRTTRRLRQRTWPVALVGLCLFAIGLAALGLRPEVESTRWVSTQGLLVSGRLIDPMASGGIGPDTKIGFLYITYRREPSLVVRGIVFGSREHWDVQLDHVPTRPEPEAGWSERAIADLRAVCHEAGNGARQFPQALPYAGDLVTPDVQAVFSAASIAVGMIVLVSAAIRPLARFVRRVRRHRRGQCPTCTYDLTGIDGVCPECGSKTC